MKEQPEWPEEYPDVEKEKHKSRQVSLTLWVLGIGLLVGLALGVSLTYITARRWKTEVAEVTRIVSTPPAAPVAIQTIPLPTPFPTATQIQEWTPEASDNANIVRPTMTPWRVQGESETLFAVHLYQENFVRETAALPKVTFSQPAPPTTRYEENGVTITHPAGAELTVGDLTLEIEGSELTSQHPNHFDIAFTHPLSAVGFAIFDSQDASGYDSSAGDCRPHSSRFTITLYDGEERLGQLPVPPSTSPLFFGVTASRPFDRLEIREQSESIAAEGYCDADFIGPIWTK